ncbi:carbon-nitrogen hydrolase family protein [Phytohabitans kaempferiae]|uniref:Carbon-nitrogen hydrolase family protein n=1 Tax=Phytohabitans kaempferiae TaxID=1620943 RepID=A0ABV6LYM0_9ACTN
MTDREFTVTRVAAAQAHPAWLDPAATARKVVRWLEDAAAQDVKLVAFPETFLGGYPFWVELTGGARFNDARQKKAYAEYLGAAVETVGPEITSIVEAARDLGVFVYLGALERATDQARGTVFCSLLAIDPDQGLVGVHRKLMPTHEERLVWGFGDGNGLVVHQSGGLNVGGLNCWENWMPQPRHALYALGEELHVSVWPGHPRNTIDLTRFIALEGRVYSLAANGLISLADVPPAFSLYEELAELTTTDFCTGGSALAAPDGSWLVEPVAHEERLIVGDIDTAKVYAERQNFDPTGHYARPDIFNVRVDRSRRRASTFFQTPGLLQQ